MYLCTAFQQWGISSFGRAFGSQSKGNGFDSRILHDKKVKTKR